MFNWLRAKVRNAVLAGVADAVETLQRQGVAECDDSERLLEEKIRLLPDSEPIEKPARNKSRGA